MTLATNKTKAVLISGPNIVENMEVTVGGTKIESKREIKCLGVIIDDRLNFKEHFKYIGAKACITQGALARMVLAVNNIDNAVCMLNMIGGTLRGDDKENTVLGVPSKCDQTDNRLKDSI